ncbi:MAG: CoA-binding protein, partial [Pseudomonadota bacterium]
MGRSIEMCRAAGFEGDIYSVNPIHTTIGDLNCYPAIEDLPVVPDASFVGLSVERSIEAISQLAALGASGAVVHASGFSELGEAHHQHEVALRDAAGSMAILGPNTMGLINNFDGVALWGDKNHCERVRADGVALISQSGAFVFGITNVERAYPMGYAISVGNQVIVDFADAIECALDDPRVRVIGLYIEGLREGQALSKALGRALEQNIPVVLLRGGGTPEAAVASLSHTGGLAVPNDFWHALIRASSILFSSSP